MAFMFISAALMVTALAGCSKPVASKPAATAPQVGHNMAGPDVSVYIPQAVVASKPAPWNLSTPENAVRSYLDWTNYAYRIAESAVATPTMSADEEVRVDSYVQYNLEKKKILDQQLLKIAVGTPQKSGQTYVVPTQENWSYQYRSTDKGNKVLSGPFAVSYDATYTVMKNPKGGWVVDSLTATRSAGTLK